MTIPLRKYSFLLYKKITAGHIEKLIKYTLNYYWLIKIKVIVNLMKNCHLFLLFFLCIILQERCLLRNQNQVENP